MVPGSGAIIDYAEGRILPCTLDSVAEGLRRTWRYGPHSGASLRSGRCSVLTHSVYTGLICEAVAGKIWPGQEKVAAMAGCFGALHDAGRIFGGSLVPMIPVAAREGLELYQRECRDKILADLGVPPLCEPWRGLVALCSTLSIRGELSVMEALESLHVASWRARVEGLSAALSAGLVDFAKRPLSLGDEGDGQTVIPDLGQVNKLTEHIFCERSTHGDGLSFPEHQRMLSLWKGLATPELVVFSCADGLAVYARGEIPTSLFDMSVYGDALAWIKQHQPTGARQIHNMLGMRSAGRAICTELS
jgi:hypothetical protein